jgi:hypothetical protein
VRGTEEGGRDLERMAESSRGVMWYSLARERAMKECWRNQTETRKTKRSTSAQGMEREGEGEEEDSEKRQER